MTYIAGRPMRDFTLDIREVDGTVTLRFDDRKDATFWLEVTLSEEELRPFLVAHYRAMIAKEMGVEPKDVEMVNNPADADCVVIREKGPWSAPSPSVN